MNRYANKTIAELLYIQKDAYEATKCAQAIGNSVSEGRYLDQLNDASSELYKRKQQKAI